MKKSKNAYQGSINHLTESEIGVKMIETIKFVFGFVVVMLVTSTVSYTMLNHGTLEGVLGVGIIISTFIGFYKFCVSPYINV